MLSRKWETWEECFTGIGSYEDAVPNPRFYRGLLSRDSENGSSRDSFPGLGVGHDNLLLRRQRCSRDDLLAAIGVPQGGSSCEISLNRELSFEL